MKQGSNQRRSRGRNPNSGGGGNNNNNSGGRRGGRNQNFDSNGPEVKVRGSAQQVLDKYLQLARDAQSSGDRVKAEGYLQYAEHYYRIVNVEQENSDRQNRPAQGDQTQANQTQANQPQENQAQANQPQGEQVVQPETPQPETAQGDAPQGERTQGRRAPRNKPQGDKPQGERPQRGRRRASPVKNEATMAAEAAAANEARATANKADNIGGETVSEAKPESAAPAPKPDSDDAAA